MAQFPFKRYLQPVRELLRRNEATNQAVLDAVGVMRAIRGRVGEGLRSTGGRMLGEVATIEDVGGEVGTYDARVCWVYPAVCREGFEVVLEGQSPKTVHADQPFIDFKGLLPNTAYHGSIRSLDRRRATARFGFMTRPAGVCGYALPLSAQGGETVTLAVSSEHPTVTVRLRSLVDGGPVLGEWTLDAHYRKAPYRASAAGCGWQPDLALRLPGNVASGVYLFEIKCAADGSTFYAPLIVRPARAPEVAVVCSTNTWNAYNAWGGRSFYENFVNHPGTAWCTHDRPNYLLYPGGLGPPHLLEGEQRVHRFLARHGIAYGVYTDDDMAAGRLQGCKTLVMAGHNEYWCAEKLAALDGLQAAGVNIVCLSGNTLFRRIVHEPDRRASCRYAFYEADEVSPRLGTIYTAAGRETGAPYEVVAPAHWIFEGVDGSAAGLQFGVHEIEVYSASGLETDKRTAFSPPGIEVVARGLNPGDGGAEWVVFEHEGGGLVTNAGSITVSMHMEHPVVDRMVWNVFRRLGHAPAEYAR